jgi:hypothetical protein
MDSHSVGLQGWARQLSSPGVVGRRMPRASPVDTARPAATGDVAPVNDRRRVMVLGLTHTGDIRAMNTLEDTRDFPDSRQRSDGCQCGRDDVRALSCRTFQVLQR